MGSFIARQPNGLYCRFSAVVDCVTDFNMTEQDYAVLKSQEAAKEAADTIKNHLKPFAMVADYFSPTNASQKEFDDILEKMKTPADQCHAEEL